MKRYEKLGLTPENVDVKYILKSIERPFNASDTARQYAIKMRPFDYHLAALNYYFIEEDAKCAEYAAGCIDKSREFFFGEWRSLFKTDEGAPSPAWWRRNTPWIDIFQYAILWSVLLVRWSDLMEFAEYPGDDCPEDEGGAGQKAYYIALARYAQGKTDECRDYLKAAIEGRSKHYRLLGDVLQSIADKNSALLDQSVDEYLKYYRQREFPKTNMTKKVAGDATVLISLARRERMAPMIGEKYQDHIVQPVLQPL